MSLSFVPIRQALSGSGGGGPTPDLLEDFSTYSSTANMIADPRGIYSEEDPFDHDPTTDTLDQTMGYGGRTQCLKLLYTAQINNCGDYTPAGRRLILPNSNTTEMWLDIWAMFSSTFSVFVPAGWNCSSADAYKFFSGRTLPAGRWGYFGIVGNNWSGGYPNNEDEFENLTFASTFNPFDDTWHRYRQHWKCSTTINSADGIYQIWMDNQLAHDESGINTSDGQGNPVHLYGLQLSANINHGPAQDQNLRYGYVAIYYQNPGW